MWDVGAGVVSAVCLVFWQSRVAGGISPPTKTIRDKNLLLFVALNAMEIWIQTTQQKGSAPFVLFSFGKEAVGQGSWGCPEGKG